jgi:transposase-like protein
MTATRRRYTDQYKPEAVRFASAAGGTFSGAAKDLGIDRGLGQERKPKLGKGTWNRRARDR